MPCKDFGIRVLNVASRAGELLSLVTTFVWWTLENVEIMRRGEILAYYEHVKVAYSVFLAEFHMWQAASWHVRSGCINHVLLHHIPCAGCWKPLMGHSGGWGSDFVELEAGLGGERGLGNGGNFGKAQDFLPSADGHHQVESGLGVLPHPMDYSIMLWEPKVQKCSASGGKGFQLRVGKLLTKFSSFCEQSGLYFFRICWFEGIESKSLEPVEIKKACEGERILSEYSSFCPKLFLIDTILKRKI